MATNSRIIQIELWTVNYWLFADNYGVGDNSHNDQKLTKPNT